MRTYSRRRPENREIEGGVEGLCRLCMQKPEESVPLFVDDRDCSLLALRIMICVGLEMTKEDILPNIICIQCQMELERCYTFRKKCEVSYQKLKSHMLAVREREFTERMRRRKETELNEVKDEESGKQNVLFTVKMDGTIQLRDGNNSLSGQTLVTLVKLEDSDFVLNPALEGNAHIQNKVSAESIKPPTNSKSLLLPITKPQVAPAKPDVPTSQSIPDTDITTFLSNILVELGILSKHEDEFMVLESSNKSIQIEAGDGSVISMELVEEQHEDQTTPQLPVQPESQTSTCNDQDNCILPTDTHTNGATKDTDMPLNDGVRAKSRIAWCELCRKAFVTRTVLARHVRDVHQRKRQHACPVCSRTFAQKEGMRRHLLMHDEKRPFQCTQCPKSFTQRGSLEVHTRLHTSPEARGLALHQCPQCPKVFLHASGVSRHMAHHSGRVYECGGCSRPFKDRSSLLRHLRLTRHRAA